MSANIGPSRIEVQEQLKRIFSSQAFEGSPIKRSLLEYIVMFSLNGEEKSGKEIAIVIFPFSDPDSTNVKANVSYIRDGLDTFYAGEGEQDSVRIELPIGRTYKAGFSYKYDIEALHLYERGLSLSVGSGHAARLQAKQCFDLAIRKDSALAIAHVARFQMTICDRAIKLALSTRFADRDADFRLLLDGETEMLDANPNYWLAWCLHGVARLIGGQPGKARRAFEKALSLNHDQTNRNVCYSFYLLLTGDKEKALGTSKLWDESVVDERLYIVRALFFYLAGEKMAATDALRTPRVLAAEMISINFLLQGLIALSGGRYKYPTAHRCIFLACCSWEEEINQGPEYTEEEKHYLSNRHDYRIREYNLDLDEPFWTGYQYPDFYLFAGFNIMTLAKVALPDKRHRGEAIELLHQLEKKRESDLVGPFQLAVACLGIGEQEKAVEYLREASTYGDNLAMHLDYWPFLEELKGHPAFEELKKHLARRYV
jgi:hypothetical protein